MPFSFQRPKFSKLTQWLRWVYNFDGIDDRGQLQFRAIDPDGDIDIEFKTGPEVPPAGCCIIDQSLTNNFAQKEFYLQFNTGRQMQPVVGGAFLSSNTNTVVEPNTTYRVTLIGSQLRYYKNGIQTQLINVTRGSFREPNAVTKVGAWSSNAGFGGFYRGHLYDIKISGILWPMADRDQPIQLPSPSGLGADFWASRNFSAANAATAQTVVSGSEWVVTRLGANQFSDGMRTGGIPTSVGQTYLFEVESASGPINTVAYTSGFALIGTSANSRRIVFTATTTSTLLYVCPVNQNQPVTVINAKVHPIGTCNPLTLVNTTSDRWQEVS